MTKDEIIRMAREAGFKLHHNPDLYDCMVASDKAIERFVELVRTDERERIIAANATEIEKINAHIKALEAAVLAKRESTNNAYKERNQLVALLSMLFPSGNAKTAIDGWDEAWHGCVYIDFPWGQASWHYHTDDEQMFAHLPTYTKPWDGHTTEAKYAAIAAAIRARGNT